MTPTVVVQPYTAAQPAAYVRPGAAPGAQRAVADLLNRLGRRRDVEKFLAANHAEVLAFAYAALKDRAEAEDAAARTYVEFLDGKTDARHFMRALKMNVLDRQRRQAYEREIMETSPERFESRESSGEDGEGDEVSWEPVSPRCDDQDPLDILIAREEAEETARLVAAAKRDPRWRFIKRRAWAAQFVADVRN